MAYEKGRLIASYTMLITAAVIFGSLFSVNKWAAMSGVPPPKDKARHGMQYTIQFAFKRDGERRLA